MVRTKATAYRSIASAALAAMLLLAQISPAMADNAPMWDSPVGLTPGLPDNTVRMVAEQVDVQVVERGQSVVAVVQAGFDMFNEGPERTMKVGFPSYVYNFFLALDGPGKAEYSPVAFTAVNLSNFRVWTEAGEFFAKQEKVKLTDQDKFGDDWIVWEMTYPGGQPLRVNVSYEQRLDGDWQWQEHGPKYVQPIYVLRTGALWSGTIGDATITMTAPSGGAFFGGPESFGYVPDTRQVVTTPRAESVLGPSGAAEVSETRLVWRLHDFEPRQDVGATYIFADTWRALRDAEAAAAAETASAADVLRAARAALDLIGGYGPYGKPIGIVERYPALAWSWAHRAAELDPKSALAWEAVGDAGFFFAMPLHKHHGELACWPESAADAYRRAVALGSPTAGERLHDLQEAGKPTPISPTVPPPCA